ncbi:DUF6241 domain-containing protein [Lysinibacillus irui]|uniref:DUF6241 domain-containing protein n=1 Tax=Lysinibacillus irui TaxID=2998077 RepID=UPI002AD1E504|nr:DUF6241 domain-containing protein [Lysinibacillus irui]MEA0564441.1 DUF6241 domain-containing protein [Lysinibacillus irui]
MKRKTKATIVIIGVLVIFGGIFGYTHFTEQVEKPVLEEAIAKTIVVESDGEILESKTKEEILYPDNLIEDKVSKAIHSMSHQKVQSGAQWGHTQITHEKVDRLLAVCKMNDYEHNDLYIPILERWSKGDFSNAVDDHNKVWKMHQGGNEDAPGKATRLSTPEEEGYYIKEYFSGNKPDNHSETFDGAQR